MRVIGLDVHRTFAEVVFLENGSCRSVGRVGLTVGELTRFGQGLSADDEVVLEATGNTVAVMRVLKPHVARVVIANPLQVKAIAHARVKTDKVDAGILAQLHARFSMAQAEQILLQIAAQRPLLVRVALRAVFGVPSLEISLTNPRHSRKQTIPTGYWLIRAADQGICRPITVSSGYSQACQEDEDEWH